MTDSTGQLRLPIARAATLTGASLLIATSAALGSYYGFTIGSAHGGALLGALLGAAALGGELLKPFAVLDGIEALGRWQPVRAAVCLLLGAVCIVYSLSAELGLAAASRGDFAAARATETGKAQRAEARYARLTAELVAMHAARPAGELRALIAGIDAKPGIVVDGQPCGGVANGPVTRALCPQRAALTAELERALERERLAAELRAAEGARNAAGDMVVADPLSVALVAYAAAAGMELREESVAPWLPLLPVLLLEFGSAFGLVVARGAHRSAVRASCSESLTPAMLPSSPAPPYDGPNGPSGGGVRTVSGTGVRRDNVTAIRNWIEANGGAATTSVRRLASELGRPRATVYDGLRKLAARGTITLEAARTGITIRMPVGRNAEYPAG